MDIGMTLIIGLVIIFIVRFFSLNIERLKGYNIFIQSKLINWMTALLLLYTGIMKIAELVLKGDRGILIYIEVIIYWVTAYRLSYDNLNQLVIKVENIHKSQLENTVEETFSKRNLVLVKEECNEDKTTFSFLDQYVKSKIHINSSPLSTKRHALTIEYKKDILNLEDILEDIDAMISPMNKDVILIKLLVKITFFVYIIWKVFKFFN